LAHKGRSPVTVEDTVLALCKGLTRDETISVISALANTYAGKEAPPVTGLPAAILTLAGTRSKEDILELLNILATHVSSPTVTAMKASFADVAAAARNAQGAGSNAPPQVQGASKGNNPSKPPSPCPKCGGDHWRSKCKQPDTCWSCKQPGHQQKDCPEQAVRSNMNDPPPKPNNGKADKPSWKRKISFPATDVDALANECNASFFSASQQSEDPESIAQLEAAQLRLHKCKHRLADSLVAMGHDEAGVSGLIEATSAMLFHQWQHEPEDVEFQYGKRLHRILKGLAPMYLADPTKQTHMKGPAAGGLLED